MAVHQNASSNYPTGNPPRTIIVRSRIMVQPFPIPDRSICIRSQVWIILSSSSISELSIQLEKRPLVGIEKLAHYFVILFCSMFTFLLLPWSLIFAVKVPVVSTRRDCSPALFRLARPSQRAVGHLSSGSCSITSSSVRCRLCPSFRRSCQTNTIEQE